MNFRKIKKSAAFLIMALLLVAGMLPLQAFATDKSAQDANICNVDLEVKLQIQGDTPLEDAAFTFVLESEDDDCPMPENTFTTRTGAGTANFGDIEFTHTGNYHYKVFEQNDGIENYIYDDTVYCVDVVVTYDIHGNMVSNIVAYDESQDEVKEPEITFVNDYSNPEPVSSYESITTTTEDEKNKTTTNKGTKSSTQTSDKSNKGDSSKSGNSPNTGDYENIRQWLEIICVAIIGLICCVWYLNMIKKRDKNNKNL
jgi:pilin isopeptide linkage protein